MTIEKIYVSMTDKFLSGWGKASGKIDKLVIECNTWEEADRIRRNAERRTDMKYINLCIRKPRYNSSRYLVSYKTYEEMGGIWKE